MTMAMDDLRPSTRAVWNSLPYRYRTGALFGPTRAAIYAHMTPRAAHYHLQLLVEAGQVDKISRGKRKHLYRAK